MDVEKKPTYNITLHWGKKEPQFRKKKMTTELKKKDPHIKRWPQNKNKMTNPPKKGSHNTKKKTKEKNMNWKKKLHPFSNK